MIMWHSEEVFEKQRFGKQARGNENASILPRTLEHHIFSYSIPENVDALLDIVDNLAVSLK